MPSENLSDGIFLPKQPYFLSGLQNLSETTETTLPSFPQKRESRTQHDKNLSEATTIFSSSFPQKRESRT
ncbi:hypothetical protein [Neisseria meningitidis]|uniref:hypothetical protein n=1 Tax=Neisseria meningitidis TaxID=487 RepID=UPI00188BEDC9|nr:hypothetical protein [Neisseria meningitidis]